MLLCVGLNIYLYACLCIYALELDLLRWLLPQAARAVYNTSTGVLRSLCVYLLQRVASITAQSLISMARAHFLSRSPNRPIRLVQFVLAQVRALVHTPAHLHSNPDQSSSVFYGAATHVDREARVVFSTRRGEGAYFSSSLQFRSASDQAVVLGLCCQVTVFALAVFAVAVSVTIRSIHALFGNFFQQFDEFHVLIVPYTRARVRGR